MEFMGVEWGKWIINRKKEASWLNSSSKKEKLGAKSKFNFWSDQGCRDQTIELIKDGEFREMREIGAKRESQMAIFWGR